MCLRGDANDGSLVTWAATVVGDRLTVTLVAWGRAYDSQAMIPPDAACWACAVGDLLRDCIADIEVQVRGRVAVEWELPADCPIERARLDMMAHLWPCPVHGEGASHD